MFVFVVAVFIIFHNDLLEEFTLPLTQFGITASGERANEAQHRQLGKYCVTSKKLCDISKCSVTMRTVNRGNFRRISGSNHFFGPLDNRLGLDVFYLYE